jgi:hypothetical protein
LYAVEPVGVASITPSACTLVISRPASNTWGGGGGVEQGDSSVARKACAPHPNAHKCCLWQPLAA